MARKPKNKKNDELIEDVELEESSEPVEKQPEESSKQQSDYEMHPKFAKFKLIKGEQN